MDDTQLQARKFFQPLSTPGKGKEDLKVRRLYLKLQTSIGDFKVNNGKKKKEFNLSKGLTKVCDKIMS